MNPNKPGATLSQADMRPTKAGADSLNVQVARKVLNETLGLKKGESLTIETWSNSVPLALSFYLEAKRMGAIPITMLRGRNQLRPGDPRDPKGVPGDHGEARVRPPSRF